ncbi:carboxylesterase family protein [Enemella sp. A6]|uniref:carboxylesterase family protein n=1 Tax=Enemella sp. A6 TaxID=3440152 RepID=UPI003EBB66A8
MTSENRVLRYPAVRYARAGRFEPPTLLPLGDETPDGAPGAVCPQVLSRLAPLIGDVVEGIEQSEDCLHLAISTPGSDGSRPVMVFLHGGAFVTGGGTSPAYDGSRLAADEDVVVVSANYRLGVFGFLYAPGISPGNLGLLDQAAALQWVRDNIAAFGGDPDRITVFGQSAGGLSALALTALPETRPVISRLIVQSSPAISTLRPMDEAGELGEFVVSQLSRHPLDAEVDELLAAQVAAFRWSMERDPAPSALPFRPTQGAPLSTTPAEDHRIRRSHPMPDLMIGYTTDECVAFAPDIHAADVLDTTREASREFAIEPAREQAREHTAAQGNAYLYHFAWAPPRAFGAVHCLELPFLLGTEQAWRSAPMLGGTPWQEVEVLGRELRRLWGAFARTGAPSRTWPRWTPERQHEQILGH